MKYLKRKDEPDNPNLPEWETVSAENTTAGYRIEYDGKTFSFQNNFSKNNDNGDNINKTILRKRVYVCTHLRGTDWKDKKQITDFNSKPPEEKAQILKQIAEAQQKTLQENIKKTLRRCYELATDDKEYLAPFAPQAFFTYFWSVYKGYEIDDEKWDRWFESSKEILKVCDSVYIYTKDGLPTAGDMSEGMREIKKLAENLGLEIVYKIDTDVTDWNPVVPNFLSSPNPTVETAARESEGQ